ncbi:thiolase domain-containing protein [Bradyrhizobium sp. Pear77]|uniref:thiolase C-terminal domain-containing protein n=1 Tax=Bradyrhizobium TaxID=374 RepID=UPI001E5C8F7B|nr:MULTISPECIES: thiolase domain-containing protein [Bradyrhizobium]MCC8958123.1 thiolase domain-containing protein [Bradyrhizobium altum]MCC8967168.1 thiolase domain-containing protein [Bradyrhizobium oropedii]
MANIRLGETAAIVGAYEHPTRFAQEKSEWQLLAEASRGAIADAGLSPSHIDALFVAATAPEGGQLGICTSTMAADYLNLKPKFIDETDVGGASLGYYVNRAVLGIHAGIFKCALIAYGATTRSRRVNVGTVSYNQLTGTEMVPIPDAFEQIYGTTVIAFMGMLTQRYMHDTGLTSEQLAHVATTMREHAARNPDAMRRERITVDDVLSSPIIATPLHKLDCCVVSDGAGAIVVAHPDLFAECAKPPVWIRGFGEALMTHGGGKTDWATESREMVARACGDAYAMSGRRPADIHTAMIYDAFTFNVVVDLEGAGFCDVGEGGSFAAAGEMKLDGGSLPVNPDGGGLASNHPGRRGIFMFIEAVRQLRGEASGRQVPDAKIAMCTATGAAFLARRGSAAHILEI